MYMVRRRYEMRYEVWKEFMKELTLGKKGISGPLFSKVALPTSSGFFVR